MMNSEDVVRMQNIAYVITQMTSAMIELEAMKAANTTRSIQGEALAYSEQAFVELIDKYQLSHNAVITNLHQ